jgi:hypothetical protein
LGARYSQTADGRRIELHRTFGHVAASRHLDAIQIENQAALKVGVCMKYFQNVLVGWMSTTEESAGRQGKVAMNKNASCSTAAYGLRINYPLLLVGRHPYHSLRAKTGDSSLQFSALIRERQRFCRVRRSCFLERERTLPDDVRADLNACKRVPRVDPAIPAGFDEDVTNLVTGTAVRLVTHAEFSFYT